MRTIRATAPLRWAPFFLDNDESCFRTATNRPGTTLRQYALRDRLDASRFLLWVNAGLPVRVRIPERGDRHIPGDYSEYAGCTWSNEALGEYIFLIPHTTKVYSPAEVAKCEGRHSANWTATGLRTIVHNCQG